MSNSADDSAESGKPAVFRAIASERTWNGVTTSGVQVLRPVRFFVTDPLLNLSVLSCAVCVCKCKRIYQIVYNYVRMMR